MGSLAAYPFEDDCFASHGFLNQTLFTSHSSAYPSNAKLAFSSIPAFQAINSADIMRNLAMQNPAGLDPAQLRLLNATHLASADGFHWSHSEAGLSIQPSFTGPGAVHPHQLYTEPDAPATIPSMHSPADIDDADNSDASDVKPSPSKKRSLHVDAERPSKKGRRGRKPSKRAEEQAPPLEDDETKREKFLERNRVAASKCRQKKKQWTSQLEDRARELTKERQKLTATVAMLKNELLELKCKCLEHSDCHCNQIRDYLKKTVALMSPSMSVYADPDLLDRRPSDTTSSIDDSEPMLSRRQSFVSSSAASPRLPHDVETNMKSILRQSLDTVRVTQALAQ